MEQKRNGKHVCPIVYFLSKTYDKFWCATAEGRHEISCLDNRALLTDVTINKVYRRGQSCEPEFHSEYLVHCQSYIDGSACEGNKTCIIEISSRNFLHCEDKIYTPTYFNIKYTCAQIHTMCTDTETVRNTLHGFILSPGYPYPMADDQKCSITIEVDPSMYIEISPIQVHLQEAIKCRGEYIEVLGYNQPTDDNSIGKSDNWKEYHTWCGSDHSANNPSSNARYLIPSNLLYLSLQTTNSRESRYFKIRYKVVPPTARWQYNSDGAPNDVSITLHKPSLMIPTTAIVATKISKSSLHNSDVRNSNETLTKRTMNTEILIGIIAVVIVLLISIVVGVIIFILIKRRRSSSASNSRKKNSPSTISNTASKTTVKSPDKAPLLEKTNNSSSNMTKQKLVPERTVQIADVTTSRFKPNESSDIKPGLTNSENPPSKPPLTAVDSGIYGVDLPQDTIIVSKSPSPPSSDQLKVNFADLPDVIESLPTVAVNPLSEDSIIATPIISNEVEQNESLTNDNEEKQTLLNSTIQENACSQLIDIASSESDGTLCGSGLQSRRTSVANQPLDFPETTDIETAVISDETQSYVRHPIPFNPLHVILQKDANKYYTTEYI
ncbi:unnamed protein product [Rotaria socialis]|uniref:CUB domain-containing protein n=1 Tax=Rotaria socialis TaxID=392032 RepID=A0A821N7U0_9BILA|nr:unnamed protein product [Rotaria socialis]CAF4448483.1 unnamed protein product [Rotaria socialis]CAF4552050.1 unnamed protein product [Rotaria socialis]CAF4556374.1 unnamed protein product [Rotaria socialis]CAF4782148.1 unnamed protein product [Rotaria socialis]